MKKLAAEFTGTFFLVFCGCGAIVINKETNGAISHAGIAVTFGLVVMCLIYTFDNISGAHFNPAVSIALTVDKKISLSLAAQYVVSQTLGALLAGAALKLLFPLNKTLGTTLPSGTALQSFTLEAILTFLLMLVILRVTSADNNTGKLAGLIIGFVILLEAMFAGPISGASMNPARSIGPALISMKLQHLWIYITAPVAGATLSVFLNNYFSNNITLNSKY